MRLFGYLFLYWYRVLLVGFCWYLAFDGRIWRALAVFGCVVLTSVLIKSLKEKEEDESNF